jgi:hypothetical protein
VCILSIALYDVKELPVTCANNTGLALCNITLMYVNIVAYSFRNITIDFETNSAKKRQ